ncbi:cellulose-binding family protein [Streptomyces collinus Tu 365]|uniref:Cellulose-binding family protein n=1 Tax=Streptomyces collinus (strain DSM 40733 / Tue 365) TaxID=1214242 RepID=S5V7Q4_STRC3|nr:cellulose-binding family protein [Streptomyces collinus Tu 365]
MTSSRAGGALGSALDGQESYVVINIGNEPWGTLMVDAPNWGQN